MSRRPIRKPDPTFPRRGHVARRDVWRGRCGLRWGRADHDGALRGAAREHCKRNQSENVHRDRFSRSLPHQCVLPPGTVDSEAPDARLPAPSRASPAGRGEPSGVYSVHCQPCNDGSVAEGRAIVNRPSPDSNPPRLPVLRRRRTPYHASGRTSGICLNPGPSSTVPREITHSRLERCPVDS